MSQNESQDIDLAKHEAKQYGLDEQMQDDLDEFVGALQDAFGAANKNELPEDLIFIALQKTFEEYYDGATIKIDANYVKRFLRTEFSLKVS